MEGGTPDLARPDKLAWRGTRPVQLAGTPDRDARRQRSQPGTPNIEELEKFYSQVLIKFLIGIEIFKGKFN